MHNDPTEYHSQQLPESTQRAWHNPYELPYGEVPLLPPPPPKQKSRKRIVFWIAMAVWLLAIGIGAFAGGEIVGYNRGQADGNPSGYNQGYAQGKTDGYNQGQQAGEQDGYSSGYTQGQADGYSSGYGLWQSWFQQNCFTYPFALIDSSTHVACTLPTP